MRRTPLTLGLALGLSALLLAACSGGDNPTLTAGTSDPAPAPTVSAVPSTQPESPAPAAEPTAAPDAPGGGTALSTGEPEGGPLTVTEVRVARQDGYDRVVFELDGDAGGVPGWRVEYVDDPRRDGSGEPVDVDGEAVLVVLISGTGYPFDTGREEAASATVPADLEVVTDVELGSVFEGTYEAFVGLSGEQPFQVTRLADPARIVVDVEHD
jgi:hypothetical protein